jgi:predicted XRE-type DNA-binding protein
MKSKPARKMTPEIAAWIKALHRDNPDLMQHQIAALVGQNQGRVCEVLTGQRFADTEPHYPKGI